MAFSARKTTAETVVSAGTHRTGQVRVNGKILNNSIGAKPLDAADGMAVLARSIRYLKANITTQDGGL